MTSAIASVTGPAVAAAGSAYTAGFIVGRIIGFAIAVALVVVGVRLLRGPGSTGRKVGGAVLLAVGILFLLGSLAALATGSGTSSP